MHGPGVSRHQRYHWVDSVPAAVLRKLDVAVGIFPGHGVSHGPRQYRVPVVDQPAIQHAATEIQRGLRNIPDGLRNLDDQVAVLLHPPRELSSSPGVNADLPDDPALALHLLMDPVSHEVQVNQRPGYGRQVALSNPQVIGYLVRLTPLLQPFFGNETVMQNGVPAAAQRELEDNATQVGGGRQVNTDEHFRAG